MKILIFGGTGFIGSDFIKRYSSDFDHLYIFKRNMLHEKLPNNASIVTLNQLKNINDINFLFHCAFDHQYGDNLNLAKYALKTCKRNNCPLIYLSTFMANDLTNKRMTHLRKSRLYDPYTLEKIKVDNYLTNKFEMHNIPLITLKPGIVYGKSGGWFNHAIEAFNHKEILLPRSGKNNGLFVYVGELTDIISQLLKKPVDKSVDLFVVGDVIKNWKEFYLLYAKYFRVSINIVNTPSTLLHNITSIHLLMYFIIKTRIGKILFIFTPYLKKIFKKLSSLKSKKINNHYKNPYRAIGITFMLQSTDIIVDLKESGFIKSHKKFDHSLVLKEMNDG